MREREAAVVVVYDHEGRVLVLRRGPTAPWMPGRWNFPGGLVTPGESVQATAYRELAEETGFGVPQGSLRWALSYRPHVRVDVFTVRLDRRPRVTMPDREHDAYQWVLLPDVPLPVVPGLPLIVRKLTKQPWNLGRHL